MSGASLLLPPLFERKKKRETTMDQRIMSQADERAEKRARVADAMKANPAGSTRRIAADAGVSQSTAFRVRRDLEKRGIIPAGVECEVKPGRKIPDETAAALRQELLSDPKRSNRLIATKIGVDDETAKKMRVKLEGLGLIPVIPREQRVNSFGTLGRGRGPGGRISLNAGETIMQIAAKGLDIEEARPEMTMDDIALLLDVNVKTYRHIRAIRLLSLRTDLTKEDMEIIRTAVEGIERERQVARFLKPLQPIIDKLWGRPTGRTTNTKNEKRRKGLFNHAVGLISDMCARGPEVEIPYLTEIEQVNALRKVNEAITCLNELRSNIRRARG